VKNLTWQNPEQLFVAQELINKVKSECCGIKGQHWPHVEILMVVMVARLSVWIVVRVHVLAHVLIHVQLHVRILVKVLRPLAVQIVAPHVKEGVTQVVLILPR